LESSCCGTAAPPPREERIALESRVMPWLKVSRIALLRWLALEAALRCVVEPGPDDVTREETSFCDAIRRLSVFETGTFSACSAGVFLVSCEPFDVTDSSRLAPSSGTHGGETVRFGFGASAGGARTTLVTSPMSLRVEVPLRCVTVWTCRVRLDKRTSNWERSASVRCSLTQLSPL